MSCSVSKSDQTLAQFYDEMAAKYPENRDYYKKNAAWARSMETPAKSQTSSSSSGKGYSCQDSVNVGYNTPSGTTSYAPWGALSHGGRR